MTSTLPRIISATLLLAFCASTSACLDLSERDRCNSTADCLNAFECIEGVCSNLPVFDGEPDEGPDGEPEAQPTMTPEGEPSTSPEPGVVPVIPAPDEGMLVTATEYTDADIIGSGQVRIVFRVQSQVRPSANVDFAVTEPGGNPAIRQFAAAVVEPVASEVYLDSYDIAVEIPFEPHFSEGPYRFQNFVLIDEEGFRTEDNFETDFSVQFVPVAEPPVITAVEFEPSSIEPWQTSTLRVFVDVPEGQELSTSLFVSVNGNPEALTVSEFDEEVGAVQLTIPGQTTPATLALTDFVVSTTDGATSAPFGEATLTQLGGPEPPAVSSATFNFDSETFFYLSQEVRIQSTWLSLQPLTSTVHFTQTNSDGESVARTVEATVTQSETNESVYTLDYAFSFDETGTFTVSDFYVFDTEGTRSRPHVVNETFEVVPDTAPTFVGLNWELPPSSVVYEARYLVADVHSSARPDHFLTFDIFAPGLPSEGLRAEEPCTVHEVANQIEWQLRCLLPLDANASYLVSEPALVVTTRESVPKQISSVPNTFFALTTVAPEEIAVESAPVITSIQLASPLETSVGQTNTLDIQFRTVATPNDSAVLEFSNGTSSSYGLGILTNLVSVSANNYAAQMTFDLPNEDANQVLVEIELGDSRMLTQSEHQLALPYRLED